MVKKLVGYLLQGILYAVPISVTLYVIFELFFMIDHIIPTSIPGVGLVALILLLILIGFLGSSIIASPLVKYFKRALDRAPLVKTIYVAIKDLVSAFVGKKKSFDTPVLVKLSKETNLLKLGFITSPDLTHLGIESSKVAVYFPHSYAFSGQLFVVETENITPIDAKSADIMKFIVSGGVTSVNQQ